MSGHKADCTSSVVALRMKCRQDEPDVVPWHRHSRRTRQNRIGEFHSDGPRRDGPYWWRRPRCDGLGATRTGEPHRHRGSI